METLGTPMVTVNEFLHTFIQLQQELQQLKARVKSYDNINSSPNATIILREFRE